MDPPKRLKNLSENITKWKLKTSNRRKDFFGSNSKSKRTYSYFFIIKIKPFTGKERRNYGSK